MCFLTKFVFDWPQRSLNPKNLQINQLQFALDFLFWVNSVSLILTYLVPAVRNDWYTLLCDRHVLDMSKVFGTRLLNAGQQQKAVAVWWENWMWHNVEPLVLRRPLCVRLHKCSICIIVVVSVGYFTHTSMQAQCGNAHIDMMLRFCARVIHTTEIFSLAIIQLTEVT